MDMEIHFDEIRLVQVCPEEHQHAPSISSDCSSALSPVLQGRTPKKAISILLSNLYATIQKIGRPRPVAMSSWCLLLVSSRSLENRLSSFGTDGFSELDPHVCSLC